MSMDLDFGSGSGISGGPTYLNRSCTMMRMNKAAAVSGCGNVGVGGLELPVDAIRKQQQLQQQQPFDSVYKSPGGGMTMAASASAHSVGFLPFTNAQWNELERQAMVFKYMMHSIPVPYELLFPSGMMRKDTHLLKFLKNGDPEPGRCRRTDGKKWRCSNGVALDQKYCEKHVHRGRPRSRKQVEATAASDLNEINKKPRLAHNQNQRNACPQVSVSKPTAGPLIGVGFNNDQLAKSTAGYTNAAVQLPVSNGASVASLFPQSRLRNGDLSEGQWNQLMQFQQHQQLSLSTCTQLKQDPQEIDLFLNLDHLKKPTRGLDDAWTVANNHNSSKTNHDLVSLALSMGHGYGNDGVDQGENKQEQLHFSNWMTQSWGPLGEVLRPTVTRSASPSSSEVIQEAAAPSPNNGTTILTRSTPTTFHSQPQSGFQCLIQDKIIKQSSA